MDVCSLQRGLGVRVAFQATSWKVPSPAPSSVPDFCSEFRTLTTCRSFKVQVCRFVT